jgi:benzoyl-CoA reductase/2-hydroxyglutaryl-CoA dehydratase subunit BcrC/BadD/HgdB
VLDRVGISIQRLSDIWAENLRFPFHWDLILPVKLNTASARIYLIQELRRWRLGLQEFIGHSISNEALRDAIVLSNKNRSLLRKLYFLRTQNPNYFSPSEVSAIVKTASFMDKEEFNVKLQQLLSRGAESRPASPETIRLFLVGSLCDQTRIFDLFDTCGAAITGDDLCTGWRFFADDASEEGDPLEALADRLLRKVPCPCKYNPGIDRGEYLLQRVEESRAQGVVFLLLKYCDPHAFDYPYLKERLAGRKIPSLLLEFEPGSIPLRAMETRLKAFVETLGG